ncbi:MAG: hypothetical protein KBS86_01975 [Proteobacteria bacterium]|nr:hypothetical protein [Candidatus Enterousia scatequi]
MKNNIKTNLKLAAVCSAAAMTLSGCAWDIAPNVIEDISDGKFLVRDIDYGTERILLFDSKTKRKVEDALPYFRVGDTIEIELQPWNNYYYERCLNMCSAAYQLRVPRYLINRRKKEEHLREQQQQFDNLKQIMMQKHQDNQR